MIKTIFKSLFLLILVSAQAQYDNLRSGDLIFQISTSSQGVAVQLATHSQYTHVGIIIKENNRWVVYEATQLVKKTVLTQWINRGDQQHFVVKRADTSLTSQMISQMKTYLQHQVGKSYDIYFNWSDDEMYCSELAWKAFNKIGVRLCALRAMHTFDLTHPVVKAKLKERYGDKIPLNENVVAPSDLFESDKMILISKG